MSHTPLPWYWKEEGMLIKRPMVYREDAEPGVMVSDIVASVFEPADAEFIVGAANSHEELLEAAKAALFLMETSEASTTLENDTYADLETAIKKAEGRER